MNKRHLSRAALSTACLTSLLFASCDKFEQPAPGLSKIESSAAPSVYVNPSEGAVPAAEPAAAVPAAAQVVAETKSPPVQTVKPDIMPDAPKPETLTPPVSAPETAVQVPPPAAPAAPTGPSITIKPVMPAAMFQGTPLPSTNPPPNLDKSQKPTLEMMVPEGVSLLSKGKPVTTDDTDPIGDPALATDGDKQGDDGYFVDLKLGKTYIQVDLEESKEVWLVWMWHFHKQGVIYRDVVVQISDDKDFAPAASTTVFNNDYDNSSGFGVGADQSYIETNNGRPVAVNGIKGRYVRFYTNGRDLDDTNQYIEVEVYGK